MIKSGLLSSLLLHLPLLLCLPLILRTPPLPTSLKLPSVHPSLTSPLRPPLVNILKLFLIYFIVKCIYLLESGNLWSIFLKLCLIVFKIIFVFLLLNIYLRGPWNLWSIETTYILSLAQRQIKC